ncbi:hypothetical protein M9Y10_035434 [Tritrichomonas musculus]|uniref:DNA methyltransferase n=1 Tax=Tritrichomonas musculus TaxID=1915356 RepID=A0ABR2KHM4_9EUKA
MSTRTKRTNKKQTVSETVEKVEPENVGENIEKVESEKQTKKKIVREPIRKNPPLPFQNNKSKGKHKFLKLIESIKDSENKTFIDLFGGSFFLSYLVHQVHPKSKIICNDFENYKERLDKIPETNKLIELIRPLINENYNKILSEETKKKIDELLNNYKGYIDLYTLSNCLLFAPHISKDLEDLNKRPYCNRIPKENYDENIEKYLEGIELVSKDWKELYDEYKEKDNIVFIIDPPIVSVDKNWTYSNNLDLIEILNESEYLLFTTISSGITEIINFFKQKGIPLTKCEILPYRMKKFSTIEEIILYHFK